MKKLILIAIAFIGLQATAQQEKKQRPNHCERDGMMMNFSSEDMATLKTKRMTLALDLNESQQKDIYSIHLENTKKCKAHMAEMKAKRKADTLTKPTPEKKFKMMNTRLDHKIAIKAKMKQILDKEQYAKWEKIQAKQFSKNKPHNKKYCHRMEE